MRRTRHWRLRRGAATLIAVLAAGGSGATAVSVASASAVTHARLSAAASTVTQTGPVSSTAASGTPALLKHTSAVDTIRQMVECNGTIYAVGKFTQIMWNGTTYNRNNAFSFSATSPYTVSSWNPNANGEVDTIALNSACSHAYLGGDFTSVGGGSADHIANIRAPTSGTLVNDWAHRINSRVNTVALDGSHLLVGGTFTSVDGDTAHPYFASLSTSTGKDDGFLDLHISGTYHYCNSAGTKCSSHQPTEVFNQQLSHGGTLDLAEGVFTSAGGQPRQQIFMLNLATSPASVTAWTSPQWDGSKGNLPGGYPYQCKFSLPFYIRAAAWAPGDQTVYIATTGAEPWNWNGKFPLPGLCDVTAAFPATQSSVTDTWVNYTGCDSLFTVAADQFAEYTAGHPRWMNNQNGCNAAGPGAVTSFGLQGRNPADGQPLLDSQGKALYSMSRANADDMLLTSAGLWIASTNRFALDQCEHKTGHAGICFLPYGS
jgi:hypothetical protein